MVKKLTKEDRLKLYVECGKDAEKFCKKLQERGCSDEKQADALLEVTNNLGKKATCYTEEALKRQRRQRGEVSLDDYEPDSVADPGEMFHHDAAWHEIMSAAHHLGADANTTIYLRYLKSGASLNQIERLVKGTQAQASRPTIRKRLYHIANRIQHAYPYLGLYEVIANIFKMPLWMVRKYCQNR